MLQGCTLDPPDAQPAVLHVKIAYDLGYLEPSAFLRDRLIQLDAQTVFGQVCGVSCADAEGIVIRIKGCTDGVLFTSDSLRLL